MNFNSILEELDKLYEESRVCESTELKPGDRISTWNDDEGTVLNVEGDRCEVEWDNGAVSWINKKDALAPVKEACTKSLNEASEEEDSNVKESVIGTALAAGAGALVGSALSNLGEDVEDTEEISVEEEAPAEEAEVKQVIIECSKCGAILIKDETDLVVDEESDLVNIEDECQYCEETEGYKIIGIVAPYEVFVEEEPVTEESKEAAEEVVEEEPVEEADDLDEIFNVNANVDLRDFGGTGNNVSVLSPFESLDTKKLAEEDDDLDELFNANINLDARGFGGKDNKVDVL